MLFQNPRPRLAYPCVWVFPRRGGDQEEGCGQLLHGLGPDHDPNLGKRKSIPASAEVRESDIFASLTDIKTEMFSTASSRTGGYTGTPCSGTRMATSERDSSTRTFSTARFVSEWASALLFLRQSRSLEYRIYKLTRLSPKGHPIAPRPYCPNHPPGGTPKR